MSLETSRRGTTAISSFNAEPPIKLHSLQPIFLNHIPDYELVKALRLLAQRCAARQRRAEIAFPLDFSDGESHPDNRQHDSQQHRRQRKPRPLVIWFRKIFGGFVHRSLMVAQVKLKKK